MLRRTIRPMLTRSRTVIVAVLVAVSVLLVACSKEADSNDQQPGAAQVLDSALQAHAAGHLDEAVRLYEKVLVLDPQNQYAYYNLGLISQTRGLVDDAAARYEQAIAVDPGFTPAMFNLAIIRAEQGAVDDAIALYRTVIAADETDANAHLNLGFLLIDTGEQREGEQELARAVELDPSLESRIPTGEPVEGGTTGPSGP
jgi:tetratricopeptide (TPR) repeat protein